MHEASFQKIILRGTICGYGGPLTAPQMVRGDHLWQPYLVRGNHPQQHILPQIVRGTYFGGTICGMTVRSYKLLRHVRCVYDCKPYTSAPPIFYRSRENMASGGEEKEWQQIEEEITCSICGDLFTDPKTIPCLHTFCKQCIEKSIESNKKMASIVWSVMPFTTSTR